MNDASLYYQMFFVKEYPHSWWHGSKLWLSAHTNWPGAQQRAFTKQHEILSIYVYI